MRIECPCKNLTQAAEFDDGERPIPPFLVSHLINFLPKIYLDERRQNPFGEEVAAAKRVFGKDSFRTCFFNGKGKSAAGVCVSSEFSFRLYT